jgi:hypothetical protein
MATPMMNATRRRRIPRPFAAIGELPLALPAGGPGRFKARVDASPDGWGPLREPVGAESTIAGAA